MFGSESKAQRWQRLQLQPCIRVFFEQCSFFYEYLRLADAINTGVKFGLVFSQGYSLNYTPESKTIRYIAPWESVGGPEHDVMESKCHLLRPPSYAFLVWAFITLIVKWVETGPARIEMHRKTSDILLLLRVNVNHEKVFARRPNNRERSFRSSQKMYFKIFCLQSL